MVPGYVLALLLAQTPVQTPAPSLLKITVGDQLTITVAGFAEYSGGVLVLEDGTISINPFGSIFVKGRTVQQVRSELIIRLRPYVREPRVYVSFAGKVDSFVYVIGLDGVDPRQAYRSEMDLRFLLTGYKGTAESEDQSGTIYRSGKKIAEFNLRDALAGKPGVWSGPLRSGDVVTVLPPEKIRVWFLNDFERTGETQMRKGVSLAKAVANVGGPKFSAPPVNYARAYEDRSRIVLKRGGEEYRFRTRNDPTADAFIMEAGDTVSLETPHVATVTVTGFVKSPAPVTVLSGDDVASAVAASGGLSDTGTLQGVLVWRNNEVRRLDLRPSTVGDPSPQFGLQDGDIVYVPRNGREFRVLGDARNPGLYTIPDNKEITAADALSLAGGLSGEGSYRKMVLLRPDKNGVYRPVQFNLDEYIKDGKLVANPPVQAGDVLFVNKPKGISLRDVVGIIPGVILTGLARP